MNDLAEIKIEQGAIDCKDSAMKEHQKFRDNLQNNVEPPMKYNKELGKVENDVDRFKRNILEEVRTMDEQVKK